MKSHDWDASIVAFDVFGEAAIAIEPGDGALDEPIVRAKDGSLGAWSAEDVERAREKRGEGLAKLAAGIAAVFVFGDDMAEP